MKTNQRSAVIYGTAITILLIPFIGMQFSKEGNWSLMDFVVAGTLLLTTAFGIDQVLRRTKSLPKTFIYIALIIIVLMLIWAELAVGVFGSPFAGS